MIALFKHLSGKHKERIVELTEDNNKIEVVCQRLESSTELSEFKQVQLEGELESCKAALEKYKKDANKILSDQMRKSSEFRAQDSKYKAKVSELEE